MMVLVTLVGCGKPQRTGFSMQWRVAAWDETAQEKSSEPATLPAPTTEVAPDAEPWVESAEIPEEGGLQILSPQSGEAVPRAVTVRGRAVGLPIGTEVWVEVYPHGDIAYRQAHCGRIGIGGTWAVPGCYFGREGWADCGASFDVWAIAEDSAGQTLAQSEAVTVTRR
jgi:hypothetical protein